MKKRILPIAVGTVLTAASSIVLADLPTKANLDFADGVGSCNAGGTFPDCSYGATTVLVGSYFAMDISGDGNFAEEERIVMESAGTGFKVGSAQAIGAIDLDWSFAGNFGRHHTNAGSIPTVSGALSINMAGWIVNWGEEGDIDMGTGADAVVTCASTCADGESFTLTYTAVVPSGGFAGVAYQLYLEGTITDYNVPPVATDAAATLEASTSVPIDLTGNVTDSDGEVDFTTFSATYSGTATITDNNDGTVTYLDNDGVAVIDSFDFTFQDDNGAVSNAATVEVTVVAAGSNVPPTANPFSVTTNKDQAIIVDVVANTTDTDGTVDPTTVAWSNAVNGTVTNVALDTGHVTFDPFTGFAGTASFDYTVKDDAGDTSNIATVTVNVNDPPFAGDTTVSVDRNSFVIVDVVALSTDSDGTLNPASVMATADANGAVSIDIATGEVTYTPTFGAIFLGDAQFTYTIDDDNGATSNIGTVTVTIVNALPVAIEDNAVIDTSVDTSVDIDVTENDTDSDGTINNTTVVITTVPTDGNATVSGTGIITYTSNDGFVGSDTLQYTVNDNDSGTSNAATVAISVSNSGAAVLDPNAFLILKTGVVPTASVKPALGEGSWFSMEVITNIPTHTSIAGFNHVHLGAIQPASSVPLSTDIDEAWSFFGNIGVHLTTAAITIATDDGAGNVTLNSSGWAVSWNGIPVIPLGEGLDNGIATMSCFVDTVTAGGTPGDCSEGDQFVLDYHATVPEGDPSNFGGVSYILHLEGVISLEVASIGPSVPPNTTDIQATDADGTLLIVQPGDTASRVGNTTGTNLSAADIGVKDPLQNPDDGAMCIGGCVDFVITDLTSDYVDVVFRLSEALPDGAKYRKLINGVWVDFNTSGLDQIGSNAEVNGVCTDDQFSPGLRQGSNCIFLRIYDGGLNDADGTKGTIADPSGALLAGSPNTPSGSTSGCSISSTPTTIVDRADWLLVAAFLVVLGLVNTKRRKSNA